jgi:hypothetical protein
MRARLINRGVSYYVNCAGKYPPLLVSGETGGSAELAPERSLDDKTILGQQ